MVLFISLEDIIMGVDIKATLQILALLFLQLEAGQDELIISTDKGKVRGLRLPLFGGLEYVAAFLGIPYAKPPLDKLRFRQPEPALVWNGIRDATRYSNSCFQVPDTFYPGFPGAEMWNPNTRISEDCLYLNVWTPSTDLQNHAKPLIPVMVWIYGGGFSTGTASLDVYDGRFLSHSQQVVVVSMNYRVGALGFLSLPESESIKGNAGLFDQRLALSWVSRNIAAFGGDPSSITLFGESAGAGSVGYHLLSQGSHGLFTRAILQSGSPNALWAAVEPAQAWNRSLTLARLLNCPLGPSADEMEACLRAVEPEKIVSLQFEVIPDSVIISVPFPPTVDGEFLADMPSDVIQSGHFLKTELLLGLNRDEGTYFLIYGAPGFGIHNQSLITRDQFLAGVSLSLPGFSDIAREAAVFQYTDWTDEQSKPKNREALGWLVGDRYISCPLLEFARRYVENGGSARVFLFDHHSSFNPWPGWMGVMHGDEIPFVFGIPLNQAFGFSKEEEALSRRIMKHWSNFARSGDPSVQGVDWPPFTLEHQQYVTLNTGLSQTLRMLRAQQCKFWDSFLPKLQYVTVSIDEVEFQWKSQFHRWRSYMLDWKNQFNDYASVKKQQCEDL
ncbi:cholinesterase-like isoform X1 [Carassius gibelio]|uniref:cholinesterase-like isoform X1 n=2 Tax=Carassius gibelio TaxID=101364 RepID=UPI002278D2C3|nr:cholinesterase-like isoform X1 [Carassius gibelio]